MPRLRTLLALAPLLLTGGPVSTPSRPVVPDGIAIAAAPVTIQPDEPGRTRVGALTLVAGWKLTSPSAQFGGWSALFVDGDRVTSINDGGALLRFRLGRFGHPTDARIDVLPVGCGQGLDKLTRDSESLARGPAGEWYVGYEWRNAICRIDPGFVRATGLARPSAMRGFARRSGAEAMLRLSDGRFLVFAEATRSRAAIRPLVVFDGDPTRPDVATVSIGYRPPAGYDATDAVQLPDGRIVVLNRRFSVPELFTTVLVAIDPAALAADVLTPDTVIAGTPIARFAPPLLSDNFEGLAVSVEGDRPYLWMISDDNQLSWEATYLLKFAIDPLSAETPKQP